MRLHCHALRPPRLRIRLPLRRKPARETPVPKHRLLGRVQPERVMDMRHQQRGLGRPTQSRAAYSGHQQIRDFLDRRAERCMFTTKSDGHLLDSVL